jgi:multiple sugar transport system permease protein
LKKASLRGSSLVAYFFVGPVQIVLALIILLPILATGWLSLQSYTYGKPMSFVGLENFRSIFSDKNFIRALVNNVVFVNIVVYGELLLGLGMAVFFNRKLLFKKAAIAVVMAPYAVSTVLGVLMWRFMLEPDIGFLNGFLRSLALPQLEWTIDPLHTFIVIIFLSIWLNVPFTFLILYNSLLGIPHELFEAARIDGARGLQVFRFITLPVILPAVLISLMFRYIFAFRTFDVVWILMQGGPYRSTELLSVYLYRRAFSYFDFGAASAVAWIMVLVTVLLGAYYFRVLYRRMFTHDA